MQALERMSARERHTQQEPKYRELLRITEQVLADARQVVQKAARVKDSNVQAGPYSNPSHEFNANATLTR